MTGQEYQELARKLADAMGPEWSYLPPKHQRPGEPLPTYANIGGPGGCSIAICRDWPDEDRISVHGCWPDPLENPNGGQWDFRPNRDKDPGSITCAIKRGPAAIAGDIARRLLPAYLPEWEHMSAYQDEVAERFAKVRGAYTLLGELAGKNPDNVQANGKFHLGSYRSANGSGTIKVTFDSERGLEGKVDWDWMPFDKVIQIVRVLQGGAA